MRASAVALDAQLATFISFLGEQVGLANIWIALTGDHGVAPLTDVAQRATTTRVNRWSLELPRRISQIAMTKAKSSSNEPPKFAGVESPPASPG